MFWFLGLGFGVEGLKVKEPRGCQPDSLTATKPCKNAASRVFVIIARCMMASVLAEV